MIQTGEKSCISTIHLILTYGNSDTDFGMGTGYYTEISLRSTVPSMIRENQISNFFVSFCTVENGMQ